MRDKRYQFQPWYVKAYRQARYRPKWFCIGVVWVLWFYVTGRRIPPDDPFRTSREYVHYLRTVAQSLAHADMGHVWTTQELIDGLRSKLHRRQS